MAKKKKVYATLPVYLEEDIDLDDDTNKPPNSNGGNDNNDPDNPYKPPNGNGDDDNNGGDGDDDNNGGNGGGDGDDPNKPPSGDDDPNKPVNQPKDKTSILKSIKHMLGLDEMFDCYDLDIIIFINAALSTLEQIGVLKYPGFHITGDLETWGDAIREYVVLDHVKQYVYMKVRVAFDPPSSSFVLDALNKTIEELEWRLNIRVDEWAHTKVEVVKDEE